MATVAIDKKSTIAYLLLSRLGIGLLDSLQAYSSSSFVNPIRDSQNLVVIPTG